MAMKNKQMTLASGGFEKYTKTTRRAQFLAQMDRIVPWAALCALIDPVYPKAGNGRPPIDLELMLRVCFLQHGFNLSDPTVEEALYDSLAMRAFAGVDLGRKPAPDEATVCNFRHLLERHDLGKKLFAQVGRHLQAKGIKVSKGTVVDATIVNAPSSSKNAPGERDPERHQTKKGNPWYFGMKAHVGVDEKTPLIHSVAATPAHVADGNMLEHLLHGKETHVWGDAAYAGRTEHIRAKAPKAKDFTQRRGRGDRYLSDYERSINRARSRVRARVEHAIGVIKRLFGFTKVRYRGIGLFVTCALANLFLVRHRLLQLQEA
jgi:IS5 family transposase